MRYQQTNAESAELLRQVLPLIARHGHGYHPVSYTIWYEYAAGINPLLKDRIDVLLKSGDLLSEESTYAIYRECVLDSWSSKTLQVNENLRGLIDDFSVSTRQVHERLDGFDESLEGFGQVMADTAEIDAATRGRLLETTVGLRNGIRDLQATLKDNQGEIARLRSDLTKLQTQALTDPLTGLFNRRGLDRAFGSQIDGGVQVPADCSLVLIDIDNFKHVNDTFGHLFGDQVIRGIAGTLREHARDGDLLARYGGEEFVLVMPKTSAAAARQNAERLRSFIERSTIRRRGQSDAVARVTVSAGVTSATQGDTLESLLARADSALYQAKNQGRNQVAMAPAA